MAATNNISEIKKVRVIFFINLVASIIYLLIILKSAGTQATWRVVCSAVGFTGIFSVTVMLFFRLLQLQKAEKHNAQ